MSSVGEITNIVFTQAVDDDGPFACVKIEIIQGASNWSFDCDRVLEKRSKVMYLNLNEMDEYTIEIENSK